ncbi:hypothetical protein [Methanogenium cariaci]|uniref:hypothetical protein n=1 Tax=Methanogenium cariaci TaxID=2197 RepID=UPI0012F6CD56|nr:hypothetical protein [Methanogenium cariaci]
MDTASVICRDTAPSGEILPAYQSSLTRVEAFWNRAAACRNKEALVSLLAEHVRKYPQESLRQMMVNFEKRPATSPPLTTGILSSKQSTRRSSTRTTAC